MWWGGVGALLALAASVASSAAAQELPDDDRAADASRRDADAATSAAAAATFREGVEAFDAGELEVALDRFRASYRLRPSPTVLYNIAIAERAAGYPALACRDLRRYLRDAADLSSERRVAIEREHEQICANIGQILVRMSLGGASIAVDGRQVGSSPLTEAVYVTPGEHTVVATRDGYVTVRRAVVVQGGEHASIELRMRPDRRATEAPRGAFEPSSRHGAFEPSARDRRSGILESPWLWAAIGVVIGAGAATAVAIAASDDDDARSARLTVTGPFSLSLDGRPSD